MTGREIIAALGMPLRKAYTVKETAAWSGVSKTAIYDAVRDGSLPAIKTRGDLDRSKIYLMPETVDEWLEGCVG